MINVAQQCESFQSKAPVIVEAAAATKADVLPSRIAPPASPRGQPPAQANPDSDGHRYAYRMIQNCGTTTINVAQGVDASNTAFHYQLPAGASWAVYTLERISCFCPDAALKVATLEMYRRIAP